MIALVKSKDISVAREKAVKLDTICRSQVLTHRQSPESAADEVTSLVDFSSYMADCWTRKRSDRNRINSLDM